MNKKGRVVITGATGLVGSNLVLHLLEEGYDDISIVARNKNKVDALFATIPDDKSRNIKVYYASLFDIPSLIDIFKNADFLFNCAAIVDFGKCDIQQLIGDNVRMTHCVAEAALEAKVRRMLHISSIATLTPPLYPAKTTESSIMTTLYNRSPYSKSKFYSEGEVWRVAEKGLEVVIINPAVIIGKGDWNNGTAQFFKIIDRCPFFYTCGIMGYVSAKDVARFSIALALREEAVGQRFILCSDNLPYKELISYIRHSLSKNSIFVKIPSSLIKALLKLPSFFQVPQDILTNLIDKSLYDGSKAEQVAGIKYTSIATEIDKIGDAFKNRNKHIK
ncbi:MAG: NAD-dependent epimerase/dehydratase family protein [Rikenellaceae bacterium]